MTSKWIFVDECGTEPRAVCSGRTYFALSAVAVNAEDVEGTRSALRRLLCELRSAWSACDGAERVLRRGHFHASEDPPKMRRLFLSCASRLRFHCKTAVSSQCFSPAGDDYDSLVAKVFAEMKPPGPWTDTMNVVVALRGAQSPATGKGSQHQALFLSVRRWLERTFPRLADAMPSVHPVKHVRFAAEPCLQLPDYCGWAIKRWRVDQEEEWLRALCPNGPGWDYEEGRLVLPPDSMALDVAADEITGVDFCCGPP